MSDAFDPYYIWLGIPPEDQPPNHYRLLGITLFENNREVIEAAANRQMAYLQEVSSGEEHIDEAQKILGELSRARICLLNREKKKAYDAELRASFDALAAAAEPEPPATTPVADEPLMPPQFGLPDDEAGDDEAGASAAALAGGLPQQPHAATAKKQSSLVPIIAAVVVTLLLIGGGLLFYLSGEAKKQEEHQLAQVAEKKRAEKADEAAAQRQAKQAQQNAAAERGDKRKAAREATERKAEEEAKRKAAEEAKSKEQKLATALEQLNNMGIKRINDGSIWQIEQLAAFYKKEKTLTKASSAADLQDVEKLLHAAQKKQAGLSTEAQTLLAQLDKQYTLKPVPQNSESVVRLREGARRQLIDKDLSQDASGPTSWGHTSQIDINVTREMVDQKSIDWGDLKKLMDEYYEAHNRRKQLESDPNIKQAIDLLGVDISSPPKLKQETEEKLKSHANKLLAKNNLGLEDNYYKIRNLEKKISSMKRQVERLDNKSRDQNAWTPATFDAELKRRVKEKKGKLKPRVQELSNKGESMSDAEYNEYRQSVGLLKGLGHNIAGIDDQPAIDFKQEEIRIRAQLLNEKPAQPPNKKRIRLIANIKTSSEKLAGLYRTLRQDPQITLALTIVGSELPPEEGKE